MAVEFAPQAAVARFAGPEEFALTGNYTLLPFRFARLPAAPNKVLLTTETGEFTFVPCELLAPLVAGTLPTNSPYYRELTAKSIISCEAGLAITMRRLASQYRSKKAFVFEGPTLFLFVVTLRCDHSCHYCQVSRQSHDAVAFDMTEEMALAAVDRIFESPNPTITVEFQGGEPLLAFPRIQQIIQEINRRLEGSDKRVSFSMTSTLHHATPDVLEFLKDHSVSISTSLDGPASVHDRHRPNGTHDSHAKTLQAIERARAVLGADAISALTTITRAALDQPEAIVDSYVDAGFRTIFLRPLSPFGFAVRTEAKTGYPMSAFVAFYERALAHILRLNARGVRIAESYASTLLTQILTPYAPSYVDLRSPQGAGGGVLVFNYDGDVYPSDEARMLAETGDKSLRLGTVYTDYNELVSSPAVRVLLEAGIAETQPACSDCAYLPYCGADPVASLARTGAPVGHTLTSAHCRRHMGLFDLIFRHLAAGDETVMRLFASWVRPQRA